MQPADFCDSEISAGLWLQPHVGMLRFPSSGMDRSPAPRTALNISPHLSSVNASVYFTDFRNRCRKGQLYLEVNLM